MQSLGQIKTKILKVLCEYSKDGTVLPSTSHETADIMLKMNTAIDMCQRRICAICGLSDSQVTVTAETPDAEISVPDGYIEARRILDSEQNDVCAKFHIAGGKIYFHFPSAGTYTFVYVSLPDSVENSADSVTLKCDDYAADIIVYAAAAELCERDDPEMYSRLKYKCDELIANRYNIDKYSMPRYNRVYGTVRKRG